MAVALSVLISCGHSEDDLSPSAGTVFIETFDLLDSGFHQSTFVVGLVERVEVSVEVRQEKHDQHICGVPSVADPFRNVLQTLTPRQDTDKETATHYVYKSQFAFFAATEGMYGVKLENEQCALDEVAAVATVQWTIYKVQE